MKEFYFSKFENRKPYQAIADNPFRTLLFQLFALLTLFLGVSYLHWRWKFSLNENALWFAIPLVLAETLSFIGTVLALFNFWSFKDAVKDPPVHFISEIDELNEREDRAVRIDVFIATYNEDVELVRYSIRDAKRMKYPFSDVQIEIYILDDGRRDGRHPEKQNMKQVCIEEEVNYITREHNEGYKAGNLKNALEQTNGDLFVILDADTRPFESLLINTTGYFRKKNVAWVQTPQWFYDTTEQEPLSHRLVSIFKINNEKLKEYIHLFLGKIKVNEDIFGNDPRLFYDVILRKRNFYNAAFCCGAGSIHRREAVMDFAIKDYTCQIRNYEKKFSKNKKNEYEILNARKMKMIQGEIIPFTYHASEDIYTSMMLHADEENRWKSIQHPDIECKMLSTQDLESKIKQHQRYAEGSLDIAFRDNPLFKRGLSFGQKICYFNTIWSYFSPIWIIVFLISPVIFFFTFAMPVKAYSLEFFSRFLPFQIASTIAFTLGCWGISTKRGEQYYISGFWYILQSIFKVVSRKKVKFNVTPKEKITSKNAKYIFPHAIIIFFSLTGILYNFLLICFGNHPNVSGFAANIFWSFFNIYALSIMIRAAYWKPIEIKT